MDNNELLMIVLAFVLGYMASGMIRQMCGGRLVEGEVHPGLRSDDDEDGTCEWGCLGDGCYHDDDCRSEYYCPNYLGLWEFNQKCAVPWWKQ